MTLIEAEDVLTDIWPPRPNCPRTCAEIDEAYTILTAQRNWEWANRSRLAKYRRHANVAIAIYLKGGSIQTAFKISKKAGLQESEVRNAKQLTSIYIEFVEGGYASLEWWENLNSVQARLINSAASKHGSWILRKEKLLKGTREDWIRIEVLANESSSL